MNVIQCRVLRSVEVGVVIALLSATSVYIMWQTVGSCNRALSPIVTPCTIDLASSVSAMVGSEIGINRVLEGSEDDITPVLEGSETGTAPVYVVEEHHEVLLYWFEAAEKGFIKREGNVLLHIDGHSDGAIPLQRDILPFFRFPTVRDIYNMMQRNDVFIVAASFTGLIKRYIWVWPPWYTDESESDHNVFHIKLGTVFREDHSGNMIKDVCGCFKPYPDDPLVPKAEECYMPNMTDPNLDDISVSIGKERCNIEVDDCFAEIVSEEKAIALMKTGHWITSQDSVILDIDEDYYGCEAAVQPLFDVNVTQKMLDWIEFFVGRTFCPSQPMQELEADKFFSDLLNKVIAVKIFCDQIPDASPMCTDRNTMQEHLIKSVDDLFQIIIDRKLQHVLCRRDKFVKIALRGLMKRFSSYNIVQLKAMKENGICFDGTPRTLNPLHIMRPCDGVNRPNDTAVLFHTPTPEEVSFRTSQLKVMLSAGEIQPGVVTVCRSMRDGYTPRKYFHVIEQDVLSVLKDVFTSVDDTSIFYDPYLLGGTFGWPNRH
ncbi:UPF0489 protein C5orf22 homolog [Haliotis asinina]|uniref:UPF0489 protein C5orf22 homolog n=1 Tax=Haliotis asinina TaxID=109174 RepID=UPI003531DDF0